MINDQHKTRFTNCSDHGGFESRLQELFDGGRTWTGCPRCEFDARHSTDPEVRAKAHAEYEAREVNDSLMASQIPPRFRPATLASYRTDLAPTEQPGVLARCRAYADEFQANWKLGRSLLLLGTMGTGKTHLACAVIQQVLRTEGREGATAKYTTASEIIMGVKDSFGRQGKTEADIYADLHSYDLLVVDEVGVQHGSDFERQVLFHVINGRYERLLPTILVSNLNLADIRRYIGDRVIDRLCDAAGEVVLFRWPSVRGEV